MSECLGKIDVDGDRTEEIAVDRLQAGDLPLFRPGAMLTGASVGAILMSASTFIVALNARLFRRAELQVRSAAVPEGLAMIRDMLTSLLLAVVLSFAWPSMGPRSGHAVQTAPHDVAETIGHAEAAHGHRQTDHHPQCEPSGMGCCVMTHCHPGMSPWPREVDRANLPCAHEPGLPRQGVGHQPDVLVPPPRALLA